MNHYFRAPGAKVTYSPRATRDYISRKARISRGLLMSPTRRDRVGDGWRFWFFSSRGPADQGGCWQVDAVRAEDGPYPPRTVSGGQICWPNGVCIPFNGDLEEPPTPTNFQQVRVRITPNPALLWNTWSGSFSSAVATFGAGNVIANPGSPTLPYVRLSAQGFTLSPSDVPFATRAGGSIGVDSATPRAGGALNVYRFRLTAPTASPCSTFTSLLPSTFTVAESTSAYSLYRSFVAGSSTPTCLIHGPTTDEFPEGGGGGGGGIPPGFIPGAGPWAYRCDCPDYAATEGRYLVPSAPSHKRDRAWSLPRPLSPCKHIASAAQALPDQPSLVDWIGQYAGDSPGTEFTQGPGIVDDSQAIAQGQRDIDYAFSAERRASARAAAQKRAQDRARRSGLALSRKVGRLWRMETRGIDRTISWDDRGRYGEPLTLQPPNWYAIDPNNQNAFAQEWERRVQQYQNNPINRAKAAIANTLRPVGNAANSMFTIENSTHPITQQLQTPSSPRLSETLRIPSGPGRPHPPSRAEF